MSKVFVVYEVWTAARAIEAKDEHDAYEIGEPLPREGLHLCNWHVVPVPETMPLTVEQQREALTDLLTGEAHDLLKERALRLHLAEEPHWLDKD